MSAAKTRTSQPVRSQPSVRPGAVKGHAPTFREIVGLIQSARRRAFQAANPELKSLTRRTNGVTTGGTKSHHWRDNFNCLTPVETIMLTTFFMIYPLAMPKTK